MVALVCGQRYCGRANWFKRPNWPVVVLQLRTRLDQKPLLAIVPRPFGVQWRGPTLLPARCCQAAARRPDPCHWQTSLPVRLLAGHVAGRSDGPQPAGKPNY